VKLNDTTSEQGLCQDTRFLLGLAVNDTVSYSDNNLIRNINAWYRQVDSWIWDASGKWEYDDSNYNNLPIATTALVASQADYSLPTTARKILRVEVLDSNGNYNKLTQIDQSQITDAMSEFQDTTGMPKYYDMVGESIMLYPAPAAANVTTTAGLKLSFSRTIDEFATTDTSTQPGFESNFHRALSIGAALDWAISKDEGGSLTNLITGLTSQLALQKESIAKFYGMRNSDMRPRIIPQIDNSI